MATVSAIEQFRTGPVGLWITIETLPYGESVQFSSEGHGIHRSYSGFSCDETHFEWQPAGDFCIRVRFPSVSSSASQEEVQAAAEAGDTGAGEWELVRFLVIESPHPYGGQRPHLRTMFPPVLALEELWYQGPVPTQPVREPPRCTTPPTPPPTHLGAALIAFAVVVFCGFVWALLGLVCR
jgi:hypothetical protein